MTYGFFQNSDLTVYSFLLKTVVVKLIVLNLLTYEQRNNKGFVELEKSFGKSSYQLPNHTFYKTEYIIRKL